MIRLVGGLFVLLVALPAAAQAPFRVCARCFLGTHGNLWAPAASVAPAIVAELRRGALHAALRQRAPRAREGCIAERRVETLPNGASPAVRDIDPAAPGDDTAPVTVPDGHVLVPDDHRDNRVDSRMPRASGGIGFVPVDAIVAVVEDD